MSRIFPRTPRAVEQVDTGYRRIVTSLPVPESLVLLERMERVEPRSVLGQPPIVWHRAQGVQVFDPWGNVWLDWSSGVLVANAGHAPRETRDAAIASIDRGLMFSYMFPTEARIDLAARLVDLAPDGMDKAYLLTTGSEAVEAAIKVARLHAISRGEERDVVVSFRNGFHGRTMGAQLAGGYPAQKGWIADPPPGFVQVPFPDGFRCPDVTFDLFLKTLADEGVTPGRVAAVIMESYQGGGASFAPASYVQELRRWCDESGALLILDEVQSGFGRTGRLFAFEHYGVVPDLACLGKAISGALPLAALLGRSEILDLSEPGSMTTTHGGNPVACASALANLELITGGDLVANAARAGDVLHEGLRDLVARHPSRIGAVHGAGLVAGVHVVGPGSDPDGDLAFDVVRRCFEMGLLMFAPVGVGGATVKIAPPLVIEPDAVREGLAVLSRAFDEAIGGAP